MTELGAKELVELFQGPGIRSSHQGELLRLIHELEVHRAEAELQDDIVHRTREELETARERYFELYELAPVGYATLDAEGRITEANLRLTELLGVQRRRLLGMRMTDRVRLTDQANFEAKRLAALDARAEPLSIETSLLQDEGRFVPVLLEASGGTTDGTLRLAIVDLTNLRHAQATLREREAHLSAVLDTVADGIVTVDDQGKIETLNAAACRLFGTSAAWAAGQSVQRLLPGFLAVAGRGRGEIMAKRADGTRFPAELAVAELKVGATGPSVRQEVRRSSAAKFVCVFSDISVRKRRDAELEEALARFRQIADHVDDAFYVVERSTGKTLYVSPAFEKIFGRSVREVEGELWPRLAFIHEDDRDRVREAAEDFRTSGGAFDVQYRTVRSDGSVRTVRSRASVVPGANRLTGIIHDMTEELGLQAELRHAQRLEAIGTLASGVAHDFNNLLMGVGGCAQFALRRLDPSHEAHAYVKRAVDAIARGANLTRQILRFSDTRRTNEDPVELDAVVAGASDLIRSLVGEHITLSVVTGAAGLSIAADPGDLEQVLLNLASNARDAMPDGGLLTLRTAPYPGGLVALSVRDTGVGMSEDTKRRVFEPFFTTKDIGKGTGLGLSTVFAVVRRMGGSVGVESAPAEGTTFTLYLPVVIADSTSSNAESESPTSGQGQTILIVDDDPLVRMTVETYVESLGYRALTAASVTDALKIYTERQRPIDVVLTDVMMPGLLGSDLNRILQKSAPQVSVIFMSAQPWQDLVRQGHIRDTARLLSKPFDSRELGAVLQQALKDKAARTESTRLRVFVVDDDLDIVEALRDLLELEGHDVAVATSSRDAVERIPEFVPDIVLSDLNVDDTMSGLEVVSELRHDERLRKTVFLAVTGIAPSRCKPAALAAGFEDVLTKPLDFNALSGLLASRVRR